MEVKSDLSNVPTDTAIPDESVVLVLQGGGALGAYQAGAYEALNEAGIEPDWIAGISIGAINGVLIAGNPKKDRISRLRKFWETASAGLTAIYPFDDPSMRVIFNEANASAAAMFGIPGFFSPRSYVPFFGVGQDPAQVSFYDTAPLIRTLNTLVDFDFLHSASAPRLSVGAVDIENGNFAYFDTHADQITARHILASGALPPGFPPVKIDGRYYWDGGLVSNTPLNYIMEFAGTDKDMCIFQVDVFSATGTLPRNIAETTEREKDIRFSSRTRFNSDHVRLLHELRYATRKLIDRLPPELIDDEVRRLRNLSREESVTVAHIIRRDARYETASKDYEFSRQSVEEHWELGRNDVHRGLKTKAWTNRTRSQRGFKVFDLTRNQDKQS